MTGVGLSKVEDWALYAIFYVVFYPAARYWLSRKERFAAKIEYDDEKTTDHRRRELLAKYAEYVVNPPNYSFQAEAKELVRRDTSQVRAIVIFYAVFMGLTYLGSLAFKALF